MTHGNTEVPCPVPYQQLDENGNDPRKEPGPMWKDLRYATRTCLRAPGFTIIALVTLTVGIAASTTIFALVNAVLLKPLPYPEPRRLVELVNTSRGAMPAYGQYVSAPRVMAWSDHSTAVSDVAVYLLGLSVNLTGVSRPQQIVAARVSAPFFRTFGARLIRGRAFTADEDAPDAADVAILNEGFWRAQFGADPTIVGRTIVLNGRPTLVVGVLDGSFDSRSLSASLADMPAVWMPLQLDPATRDDANNLLAVARLTSDAMLQQARAQAEVASNAFREQYPGEQPLENSFDVVPLATIVVGDTRASLLLLFGAVALVVLIVCANTANLLLSRASARRHEFAIRAALGAGRGRLVGQMLFESVLLSMVAGLLGVAVAALTVPFLLGLQAIHLPRLASSSSIVDARTVLFAVTTSITIAIALGLAPALSIPRLNMQVDLRSGGRSGGSQYARTRTLLLITEVAIANALVIACVLLVRSLVALYAVDPGFDKRNVVTLKTAFADSRFATSAGTTRVIDAGLEQLSAIPEVAGAAVSLTGVPLEEGGALRVDIPGRTLDRQYVERWAAITPGYFDVFKIPLRRGRLFTERDRSSGPPVAIINESMARQLWPHRDPLHDRILIGRGGGPAFEEAAAREIIGIVADTRQSSLSQRPAPGMYVPIAQIADPLATFFNRLGLLAAWAVQTRSAPGPLAKTIQQTLLQATGLPTARTRTMDDVVESAAAPMAANVWLMTVFAVIAFALALVGLYAISAYSVEQRTRELGIRVALGATPSQLRNSVIAECMRAASIGIAVGVAAAGAFSAALRSFLFGVTVHDPATYVAVPALLAAAAMLGAWIPARRAARVDPLVALRTE